MTFFVRIILGNSRGRGGEAASAPAIPQKNKKMIVIPNGTKWNEESQPHEFSVRIFGLIYKSRWYNLHQNEIT